MAFKIGEVLSPTVAAALIRRGEVDRSSQFVRNPTRKVTRTGGDVGEQLAILREERQSKRDEQAEARALRGEKFQERGFEFTRGEAGKSREERKGKGKREGRKLDLAEAKLKGDARKEAQRILANMDRVLRGARKINPLTGKPDQNAVTEAQTIAAGMWAQIMSLPISDEDKRAMAQAMQRLLPQTPGSRAPGNSGSGGSGGSPIGGGSFIDPTFASDIGIPTRTP